MVALLEAFVFNDSLKFDRAIYSGILIARFKAASILSILMCTIYIPRFKRILNECFRTVLILQKLSFDRNNLAMISNIAGLIIVRTVIYNILRRILGPRFHVFF